MEFRSPVFVRVFASAGHIVAHAMLMSARLRTAAHRLLLAIVLIFSVVLSDCQKAWAQNVSPTGIVRNATTDGPHPDDLIPITDEQSERDEGIDDINEESSVVELDPVVVSASRFAENSLTSPASITIVGSRLIAQEGVPSVVATLRTVPGVDLQQAGINRYLLAVRGFNHSFTSRTYTMVDNREAFNPGLGLIAYTRLPIDALDVARVEIVRGPGSALYGPGVDQGIIHFISKDPFTFPGTSISVGVGTQAMLQTSFRHAGVFKGKLGYKITGSFMNAEDWKLDPGDPDDAEILSEIEGKIKDLNKDVVRVINGRDYDAYSMKLNGQVQYRFSEETRLTAYAGYAEYKNIVNSSLGEIQVDGPGVLTGQLQFQSGPFYAQAYGTTIFADEKNWFYRSGDLMYERSSQVDVQAQYKLNLFGNREAITFGADYKITTPRTKGTVSGRFEDEDTFSLVGGYLHSVTRISEKAILTASGRIDYLDATGNAAFSPRVALVYQSTPEQTFRLTYNRALSRPSATSYFADLKAEPGPPFGTRFMGSAGGFHFPSPRQTSSFIEPGGRDTGIGIATARAYSALAPSVAGHLQPDTPEALEEFLRSRTPDIEGFSEGIMTFPSSTGAPPRVVPILKDIEPISETTTETFELGYKGLFADRVLVTFDGYYTTRKDFQFDHVVTPFVVIPVEILSTDLQNAVLATITDEELAPFGIDVETLASGYALAGAGMGGQPIGILEPDENYNPTTMPEMVLAMLNAGHLDYYGVDVSVEAFITDRLSGFANYSWVSENYFDDDAIGLPDTGFDVSMNAPRDKFRAGLTYRTKLGITVSGSLRYVSSFRVAEGRYYKGTVDSYTLVDAGLMYDFAGPARGLNLAITVQNVFDTQHREYIGFPTIGRLVTSRLTYTF